MLCIKWLNKANSNFSVYVSSINRVHTLVEENAINKDYLLDKAVYDYKNPKQALSSGNGYVDILLVLSIVATLGLAIFLLTIFVF